MTGPNAEAVKRAHTMSLAAVIERFGAKFRSVGNAGKLNGECPRCGSDFTIRLNLRPQVWECRVCGVEATDPVKLAQHLSGLSWRDAVERLADDGYVFTPQEEGSEMNHKRFHGDRDRLSDHDVVDDDGAPEEPRRSGNGDGRDTDPRDPEAYYDARKPSGGGENRPTIELRVGGTEQAVNELERLLIASDRGLYQRGGFIVSTGFAKMLTWDGKEVIGQVIETRGDYALIEDAEAVAKFTRLDEKGKPRPCPPPMSLVRTLKDRKLRLRLPVLAGIVNCPSITVDGRLLEKPGYDPATGVLYDPLGVSFPRVPDFPDRARAEAAMARIKALIRTFDFETDDDRAVALSLILSAIARRGLPFTPLHGFDAPVAGAGKSMLVDIASILATGHEAGVTAYETPEEGEKRLSSILMRGDPIVALDNCEAALEGALLNQALTQYQAELRILGQSRTVSAQSKALFTATGNGLIIKGDLVRRSVVGKLDPKCEQPEMREFDYDPIADAKQNRGEIVAAALTVLKAYHAAGQPSKPKPPLQSFVHWSNTVRAAVGWLGEGDPVNTMARLRSADPTRVNLRAVLSAWRDQFGDSPQTSDTVIETANATTSTIEPGTFDRYIRTFTHPALRSALLAVAGRGGAVIDVRALGGWLSRIKNRVVNLNEEGDAKDEVALEFGGILHGSNRWKVANRSPSDEQHGRDGDEDDQGF